MASESTSGEKTEEGSEKKTREAIERGNVPFSREASVFLSLGAMLAISALMLRNSVPALADALSRIFANPTHDPFATTADTLAIFQFTADASTQFLMPILFLLMMAGLVAGFAQGVPHLSLERITPKWSKLSPMSGLKRLLGRDGQVEFAKNVLKLAIICGVCSLVLRGEGDATLETLFMEPSALGGMVLGMIARLIAAALAAFALLAATDVLWSRVKWKRDLRMTKQEVKDEQKELEGDPIVKAKRRSLAMERSRKRMMASVPKATLVIANPTHYAIALRYVREEGGAPMVIAKGQDLVALKIREIAESHKIPVIEDKALARSMYDRVEISQMIPAEFYKAVAELIHFLQARSPRAARPALKG